MRIVVTGASGFVGKAVLRRLLERGHEPVAAVRANVSDPVPGVRYVVAPDLAGDGDWTAALTGADAVIHAAARVHMMTETHADPLAEYRRVNVEGTLRLARAAIHARVRRFVFVSSIKVNGETTRPNAPFRADAAPQPINPYGVSKLEAEQALLALDPALEVAVVRPPLVYGPGVRANFRAMMRMVRKGVPLPLGAVRARRSLVAVSNLADLLVHCAEHPAAPGGVFLVSDGEDLSISDLLRRLGEALGRPARLVPIPPAVIALAARLLGKRALTQRLLMPLQVDIAPTRAMLEWAPPFSAEQCLRETASHFIETNRA